MKEGKVIYYSYVQWSSKDAYAYVRFSPFYADLKDACLNLITWEKSGALVVSVT